MTSSATIEPDEPTLQQTLLASAIADDAFQQFGQTEFASSAVDESILICDDRIGDDNNAGEILILLYKGFFRLLISSITHFSH
jgi:hypothetical protein